MLVNVLLAILDFASTHTNTIEEKCYGNFYEVPLHYTHPMVNLVIYYRQRGEEKRLVYADGQSKDKRISASYGHIRLKDLTEQDDSGVLDLGRMSSVTLVINDCSMPKSTFYGFSDTWKIAYRAEYLEFAEMSSQGFALKPKVIWNRTDPSIGRGRVEKNYFHLDNLRQKDSGYYKFRGGEGRLIEWKRLTVKAFQEHIEHNPGETLRINFSVKFTKARRILFKPHESDREQRLEPYMNDRMEFTESHFSIFDLKTEDSGIYKFEDDEGFLALRLELEVYSPAPVWVYILPFVIILLCIVCCCCCVKKCCCKKSSNKRSSPATEAAAPPVYYHNTSQSTQPAVPLLEREPRVITSDPPIYNSADGDRNVPTSTQVTLPEGQGPTSTSIISISSNSNPQFEFKGMVFPSAPPLSSDTPVQDVYTSDKLNFL